MDDFVTALGGITILVFTIGCIPYGIWLLYSAYKKKWKLVLKQVVYPGLYFLSLLGLSYLSNIGAHAEYLKDIFDCEVQLDDTLYEYDSQRAFNGDGYSITVYQLPQSIRERFESVDENLLSNFPIKPDYRNHWDTEFWRQAPFDSAFDKYLDFALSGTPREKKNKVLDKELDTIRVALRKETTYYAFFKYDHGLYPGDIDFFVVDLEAGRVYSINCNT